MNMLKLNEGYTVYVYTPIFGYHEDVVDEEFSLVKSRLSKDEAVALAEKLNAERDSTDQFCYRIVQDLTYHGFKDPIRWITDRADYDALVKAGEIHREVE